MTLESERYQNQSEYGVLFQGTPLSPREITRIHLRLLGQPSFTPEQAEAVTADILAQMDAAHRGYDLELGPEKDSLLATEEKAKGAIGVGVANGNAGVTAYWITEARRHGYSVPTTEVLSCFGAIFSYWKTNEEALLNKMDRRDDTSTMELFSSQIQLYNTRLSVIGRAQAALIPRDRRPS